MNPGRISERANELERDPQNLADSTPRFARTFSTWNPHSQAEGAYPKNCMVELPRNQVSELHFGDSLIFQLFSVGRRISRPKYVLVQVVLRMLCCQWTIW